MAEDNSVDSPKRKRGRPAKAQSEKVTKVVAEDVAADADEAPKRGRGRPPKPDSEKVAPKRKTEDAGDDSGPKRGRGRPKGSTKANKEKRGAHLRKKPKEAVSEEEENGEEAE